MQTSESISEGLSLNTLQIKYRQIADWTNNFMTQHYELLTREIMGISLKEMFKIRGTWSLLQKRSEYRSQMLSFMAGSMAKMHSINQKSKNKFSSMIQENMIIGSRKESLDRRQLFWRILGLLPTLQLFGKSELTSRIEFDRDIEYPIEMVNRYAMITYKCKRLREKMASKVIRGNEPIISFAALSMTVNPFGTSQKKVSDLAKY